MLAYYSPIQGSNGRLKIKKGGANIEEKKRDEMCNRGFENRKGGIK